MKRFLLDFLIKNWDAWKLGEKPNGLECLLLNYMDANFVIFKENDSMPCLLVKVSKNSSRLNAEFENLKYLNIVAHYLAPKPYKLLESNGYLFLIEEFIVGKKILYHSKWEDKINIAFRELILFHEAVKLGSFYLDNKHFEKLISIPISKFLMYGASDVIKKDCLSLLNEIEKYKEIKFPYIPQHCDFSFTNILFVTERIKVIDWVDFGETYLPLHDAFTLMASLYFNEQLFHKFLEHDRINGIFKNKLLDYCVAFGIPSHVISNFLPLSLIIYFNSNKSFMGRDIAAKLLEYYFRNKMRFFLSSNG